MLAKAPMQTCLCRAFFGGRRVFTASAKNESNSS